MTKRTIPTGKLLTRHSPRTEFRAAADGDGYEFDAALSSEYPVRRFFGNEILVHEAGAVDLSRAEIGDVPLLDSHDSSQFLGVVRDIHLDESARKLRGRLVLSPNRVASREVAADMRDGLVRNLSIGYQIREFVEREDSEDVRVTEWELHEVSIAAVPADPGVGLNRSEDLTMTTETESGTAGTTPASTQPITHSERFSANRARALTEGRETGARAERERVLALQDAFAPHVDLGPQYRDALETCIRDGLDLVAGQRMLLDLLQAQSGGPVGQVYRQAPESSAPVGERSAASPRVRVESDEYDNVYRCIEAAVMARARRPAEDNQPFATPEQLEIVRTTEYSGYTLFELGRAMLQRAGISTAGMNRSQIVGAMFTRGVMGHGSSDFANLLSNVANKALMVGWTESEETWSIWTTEGSTADFKQFERSALSAFDDLELVEPHGEFKQGSIEDFGESAKLATYGKLFSISRQAIINDDMGAFTRIPGQMGRAAQRMIGDLVYTTTLVGNPNMSDGTALFVAGHSNLTTGGVAPSTAAIEAVRTAMATQKDPSGNANVGVRPAYLLCPVALEGTCKVLQANETDPSQSIAGIANPVAGTFQTVAEHRLDSADATEWYMAANGSQASTIEVTFLEGARAPYMEERNGWTVDGAEYKVRIDAVVKALDWRGLHKVT